MRIFKLILQLGSNVLFVSSKYQVTFFGSFLIKSAWNETIPDLVPPRLPVEGSYTMK